VQQDGEEGEEVERRRPRSQTDVNVDTGSESDLRFDVRTWFLKGLSQESVRALDDEEIDALHEAARQEAQRHNPKAQKGVLAYETLRWMERKWDEGLEH
jgi:hypothetical protein